MCFSKDVIVTANGCHEWQRSCNSAGYAQKTIAGRYWTLHRYVFNLEDPSLSATDVVRHLCHNRKCINPDHLEKGSHIDNWRDSESTHRNADATRRKCWFINVKEFPTLRVASRVTGISQSTIVKYTCNLGVFDVAAYLVGCKTANVTPSI
jgi:hypothetical protein